MAEETEGVSPTPPPPGERPYIAVWNGGMVELYTKYEWEFLGGRTVEKYLQDEGDDVKPDFTVGG